MAWNTPFTAQVGVTIKASDWNTYARDNLNETAVAKVTTAGDMVVATGANALVRLAAVAAGQVLSSAGVGAAPVWAAPTVASSLSARQTVNTTISATSTWTEITGLSLSLPAGDWIVFAQFYFDNTGAAGAANMGFRIYAGGDRQQAFAGGVPNSGALSQWTHSLISPRFTLASTTTAVLEVIVQLNAGGVVRDTAPMSGTDNVGVITAIRVA